MAEPDFNLYANRYQKGIGFIDNDMIRKELEHPHGKIWLNTNSRIETTRTDWTSGGQVKVDMSCHLSKAAPITYTAKDELGSYEGTALRVSESSSDFNIDNYLAVDLFCEITHTNSDSGQIVTANPIIRDYYNHEVKPLEWTTDLDKKQLTDWVGTYIAITPVLLYTSSIRNPPERRTRISIVPGNIFQYGFQTENKDRKRIEGNRDRGHIYSGKPPQDRLEIPLPCLIGAGKYEITITHIALKTGLNDFMKYGDLQEIIGSRNRVEEVAKIPNNPITINPILANDNTKLESALIAELPFNDDVSNPRYYEGQYPTNTEVPICLHGLNTGPEWLPGTEAIYAVIYLMLTSPIDNLTLVSPENCFKWYELRTPISKQQEAVYGNPSILAPEGHEHDITVSKDDRASTFRIKTSYPFLLKHGYTPPQQDTELLVKMGHTVGLALQFITLVYRVVADGTDYYKVDPKCPTAIEMHTGICTPGGLKRDCVTIKPIEKINLAKHTDLVTFSIVQWQASNPLYLQIKRQIVSEAPIADTGLEVEFSLINPNTNEVIQTAPERFLLGIESEVIYDVLFQLDPKEHKVGNTYTVRATIYDRQDNGGENAFDYTITTNTPTIENKNVIDQVSITPKIGGKNVTFVVSDLLMNSVPETTTFWYTLTGYEESIDTEYKFTAKYSSDAVTPNKLPKWSVPVTFVDDSTTYIIVFEVWETASPNVLTQYPVATYAIKYTIDMGELKNISIQETYKGADKITDDGKVKTTWSFAAETTLPIAEGHVYNWIAELIDLVDQQTRHTWNFEEQSSTLNVADTTKILIPIGHQYGMTLRVSDSAVASTYLETKIEGTIGGPKIEGKLGNGVHSIELSDPIKFPHPTNAEYRLLKDGFVGAVESPWEMRNETVVGSMSAGSPVWMVHPRDLSFRVLVTASDANIVDALKTLIALLTVNPRLPIDLNLWTSDGTQNLTISGYPEIGTPIIEMRESTGAIVAITLKCPRYAWRGKTVHATPKGSTYEIPPAGNLPPAFDLIIRPINGTKKNTRISLRRKDDTQPESITLVEEKMTNVDSIRIRYDPIMQDLAILARYKVNPKPRNPQNSTANNTVPTPMSRCKLAKSPVWLVRNDDNATLREKNAFFMLDAKSDLRQLNLTPGVENIIETDGIIESVSITPYYAHWW